MLKKINYNGNLNEIIKKLNNRNRYNESSKR